MIASVFQVPRRFANVSLPLGLFLFGFGSLAPIYFLGDWSTEPGLFYFRSATIGDGLLIPSIAFCGLRLMRVTPSEPTDLPIAALGGMAGAAAGGYVIHSWNSAADSGVNWTMPAPGDFNKAGIYHAVFLIACSAVLGCLVFLAMYRLRRLAKIDSDGARQTLRSPLWISFVAAGLLFAGLLAVDADPRRSMTAATSVALVLVSVMIALLLVFVGTAVSAHTIFNPVALAGAIAVAGTWLAAYRHPWSSTDALILVAAAGVGLSCAAGLSVHESNRLTAAWTALAGTGYALTFAAMGLIPQHSGTQYIRTALLHLAIGTLLILLITFLVRRLFSAPHRSWIANAGRLFLQLGPGWVIFASAIVGAWFANHRQLSGDAADLYAIAVALPILTWVSPLLRRGYHTFVLSEEANYTGGRVPAAQRVLGRLTTTYAFGIAVAAVAVIFLHTISISVAKKFDWSGVGLTPSLLSYAVPVGIMTVAGIAIAVHYQASRPSVMAQGILSFACVAWAGHTLWQVDLALRRIDAIELVLVLDVILLSVIVGVWAAESLFMNGVVLDRNNPTRMDYTLCISVGVMLSVSALGTATVCQVAEKQVRAWESTVALALFTLLMAVLLIFCAGIVTARPTASQASKGTNYGPLVGVLQDAALICCLILVLIFMPILSLRHAPGEGWSRAFVTFPVLLGFVSFFGSVFCWILRYNTRHAMFRRSVIDGGPWPPSSKVPMLKVDLLADAMHNGILGTSGPNTDREWVRALERHTTFQNVVGLACVVLAVLPFLILWAENPIPEPD